MNCLIEPANCHSDKNQACNEIESGHQTGGSQGDHLIELASHFSDVSQIRCYSLTRHQPGFEGSGNMSDRSQAHHERDGNQQSGILHADHPTKPASHQSCHIRAYSDIDSCHQSVIGHADCQIDQTSSQEYCDIDPGYPSCNWSEDLILPDPANCYFETSMWQTQPVISQASARATITQPNTQILSSDGPSRPLIGQLPALLSAKYTQSSNSTYHQTDPANSECESDTSEVLPFYNKGAYLFPYHTHSTEF